MLFRQGEILDVLESAFSKRLRLFSTPCVINELRALGDAFSESVSMTEHLSQHQCGHRNCISAADCLLSCIGKENTDHWWIATQDRMLREALNQIPGVPCLFLTYNGVFVETPSEISKKAIWKAQTLSLDLAEWERSTDALKDLEKLSKEHRASKFRRKRAKGPNPLSCLPKRISRSSLNDAKPSEKRKRQRRPWKQTTQTQAANLVQQSIESQN
eukprot:g1534.t1